jgi:hypothetical protein
MASADIPVAASSAGPFSNPWPFIAAGVSAVVVGALLALSTRIAGVVFPCVLIGLVAAGAGVAIRPRSALVLAAAAAVALIASVGMDWIGWDSARTLLRVLSGLAVVAAVLIPLPTVVRRLVISLAVLVHFGTILTAVMTAPPPNGEPPWLAQQAWVRFSRPYLQFMYLNNAYHFYSPEPGPARLLWFLIEYERDGDRKNYRWVKVPDVDDHGRPVRPDHTPLWPNVEFTRRLSLVENAAIGQRTMMLPLQELGARRYKAGNLKGVPMYPGMSFEMQYLQMNEMASMPTIRSYVRHVAHTYKHEKKPDLNVTGVKVYIVTHRMLYPQEFADGVPPFDRPTYLPFFIGDFNADGSDKLFLGGGDEHPGEPAIDPFRFWLIPILRTDGKTTGRAEKVANYVLTHAGVEDEDAIP